MFQILVAVPSFKYLDRLVYRVNEILIEIKFTDLLGHHLFC